MSGSPKKRSAPRQEQALVVFLADLEHLDEMFADLKKKKSCELPLRPAKDRDIASDVLLASGGPKNSGDLYVFVGIVRGAALSADRSVLRFKKVERFWRPVVGVYGKKGHHRPDLMGDLDGWGPSGIYYVPHKALTLVPKEAEESLCR